VGLRHYLRQSPHLVVFATTLVVAAIFLSAVGFFAGILAGFFAMFVVPPLALFWTGIFLFHLFRGNRRPDQREAAIVLCSAPFVFFGLGWITIQLCLWGTFAIQYSAYQNVIALAEHNRLPPKTKTFLQTAADGTEFQIETMAPKRIVFALPGGFLNEWQGILYDPQGIGQRPGQRQENGKVQDLFDNYSTIEGCSHLIGRFYHCGFS
jgi:hypothetical protein